MDRKELTKQVIEAVGKALKIDTASVTDQTRLIQDLSAESIDFLDIQFEIEKLTGKEVDFKKLAQIISGKAGAAKKIDIRIADVVDHLLLH